MSSTQCPVCFTVYGEPDHDLAEDILEECGGEGNCPARSAGERPSQEHVLCACNRTWLPDCTQTVAGHGWNDCLPVKPAPRVQPVRADSPRSDGGVQKSKRNPSDLVKEAKLMVYNLFKQIREEEHD